MCWLLLRAGGERPGVSVVELEGGRRRGRGEREDAHLPLGRALVLVKLVLPLELSHGELDALDDVPLGDGQAALGEAGHAADDDDAEDEAGDPEQVAADKGAREADLGRVRVRRGRGRGRVEGGGGMRRCGGGGGGRECAGARGVGDACAQEADGRVGALREPRGPGSVDDPCETGETVGRPARRHRSRRRASLLLPGPAWSPSRRACAAGVGERDAREGGSSRPVRRWPPTRTRSQASGSGRAPS